MSLVCLVTGSTRGIGLAIAKRLLKLGHKVILNGRRSFDIQADSELDAYGENVDYLQGDISNFEESAQMIQTVIGKHQKLDVLINNAGITRDGLFMRMSEADYDEVLNINLKGAFNMCRQAVPYFVKQRSGTIINISSVVGLMGNAGQVNYAASKAGLIGLTKALAREVASRAITVNAIAPGFIETEMTASLSERVTETMLQQIPLKRFGQADEVAHCVQFLMENRYVTGQVVEVNGGIHI